MARTKTEFKASEQSEAPAGIAPSGMTPFEAGVICELHNLAVAITALVACRPAVPQEVTQQRLEQAETKQASATTVAMTSPPPRDAEVAQAAQVLKAERVEKPARQLSLEDTKSIITDAVERGVVQVPAVKLALQTLGVSRVAELAADQYDPFLTRMGL